ncbi:MAG: hypothetical protein F6K62_21795 [Sphaerospermopsis sp. SIO1G2]|nr:hypothetical protein [Sphaerospermopsis sp. SIO1G2]
MFLKNILLNNNNNGINPIRIGIWGAVGAGKTIYLTKLFECLEQSTDWRIAGDQKAQEFIEKNKDDLNNELKPGRLPKETDPGMNQLEIFRYTITSQSSRFGNLTIVLEFIDASGEFYENYLGNVKVSAGKITYNGIIEYLMSCHGIIFLLDPLRRSETDYQKLLSNLFREFRSRSRSNVNQPVTPLEQYMAFCVTKVDEEVAMVNGKIRKKVDLSIQEYQELKSEYQDWLWKTATNPDNLVTQIIGRNMSQSLSKEYAYVEQDSNKRRTHNSKNRCNFYAISAFGRYQDEYGKLSTVFVDPQSEIPDSEPETTNNPEPSIWSNQPTNWDAGFGSNDNNQPPPPPDNINLTMNPMWEVQQESSDNIDPNRPTIKQGVPINPMNILVPLEWLITAIRKHPPVLVNPKQLYEQRNVF